MVIIITAVEQLSSTFYSQACKQLLLFGLMKTIAACRKRAALEHQASHTTIFVLSDLAASEDRLKVLKVGVDEYLEKPVRLESLEILLSQLIYGLFARAEDCMLRKELSYPLQYGLNSGTPNSSLTNPLHQGSLCWALHSRCA